MANSEGGAVMARRIIDWPNMFYRAAEIYSLSNVIIQNFPKNSRFLHKFQQNFLKFGQWRICWK